MSRSEGAPSPVVKRAGRLHLLVWLAPLLAAAFAGWYLRRHLQTRGVLVTVSFPDVSGIRSDSLVVHRGVGIGQVESMELSPDKRRAYLGIRLRRGQEAFAAEDALYWIVKPRLSESGIGGLNALASGPYIEALAGQGAPARRIHALAEAPTAKDGVAFTLVASHLFDLRPEAPISYRGIKVGTVSDAQLTKDSVSVEVRVLIDRRYRALVREHSHFWFVTGFDVKAGLFSGVELKLESLRKMLSGAVGLATPDKDMGAPAKEGTRFTLEDEPPKDWLRWQPRLMIAPASMRGEAEGAEVPTGRDLMQRKTGE